MQFTSATIPPEVVAELPPFLQAQVPVYDDNLRPNLYAVAIICLIAAYVAVGLRLWSRSLKGQRLAWDDYTILIALVFTSAFVALFLFVTVMGLGRHLIVMVLEYPENSVPFAKGILAAEVFYNPGIFFTKVSILCLFNRIFENKTFKRVSIGVGLFVLAYCITAIMTNIFQCVPVEADWNPALTPRCVNLGLELVLVSSINVVTDAVILCLPMPFIWRLHTDRSRKLQLTAMFLLGGFIVVVSIIRATYVSAVSLTDGSWADSYGAIWSVVETCLAIVAACLPLMRPVFNKLVYGHVDGTLIGPTTMGANSGGYGTSKRSMNKGSTKDSYHMTSGVAKGSHISTTEIEDDEGNLVEQRAHSAKDFVR